MEKLADKYEPIGVRGTISKVASASYFILLGECGAGKSHFVQSCECGAVVNCEQGPTTHSNPVAEVWPTDNMPSDFRLDWPGIVTVCDHFVNHAGQPGAPKIVFFDSIPEMVRLAREYAANYLYNKREKYRGQSGVEKDLEEMTPFDVRFVDGQTCWDLTYDWVMHQILKCRRVGLGVGLIVHLDWHREVTKSGETTITTTALEPTPTENFWKRLNKPADGVFIIRGEPTQTTVKVPKPYQVGGKTKTRMTSKTIDGFNQTLLTRDSELQRYLKGRADHPLPPSIDITTDGWAALAHAYDNPTA